MKSATLAVTSIVLGCVALIPGFGLLLGPIGVACALPVLVRGDQGAAKSVVGLCLSLSGYGIGILVAGAVMAATGTLTAEPFSSARLAGDTPRPIETEFARWYETYSEDDASEPELAGEPVGATGSVRAATAEIGAATGEEDETFAGDEPLGAEPTETPDPLAFAVYRRTAPSLTWRDLEGNSQSLASHRGKIVFVNLWATWCGWCKKEMADLEDLYVHNDDVVVLGVSTEDEETLREFDRRHDVTYPLLVAAAPLPLPFDGVKALPTTFVINREGLIQYRFVGYQKPETWRRVLDELRD